DEIAGRRDTGFAPPFLLLDLRRPRVDERAKSRDVIVVLHRAIAARPSVTGTPNALLHTRALRPVTRLAQELDVPLGAAAAESDRDDVIEFEQLPRPAPHALPFIALPHEEANRVRYPIAAGRRDFLHVLICLEFALDAC